MSPYRSMAERSPETIVPGPRWGATQWAKFWVKHKTLEHCCFWAIIVFVVIPIRIVACPFNHQDPFDF